MSTFEDTQFLGESSALPTDGFDNIIREEFDPAFVSNRAVMTEPAGSELTVSSAEEMPFGFFVIGDAVEDPRRAAMASGTGYTGNNGEESN